MIEIIYLFAEELFGHHFMFGPVVAHVVNQLVESGVHESLVLNGPGQRLQLILVGVSGTVEHVFRIAHAFLR